MQDSVAHSLAVSELLEGLLRMPNLTALQVAAVQAVLPLDLAAINHLQHYALACFLLRPKNTAAMPPATPSTHLLTLVRTLWHMAAKSNTSLTESVLYIIPLRLPCFSWMSCLQAEDYDKLCGDLQRCLPGLASQVVKNAYNDVVLAKRGPPHDLDLDVDELMEEFPQTPAAMHA